MRAVFDLRASVTNVIGEICETVDKKRKRCQVVRKKRVFNVHTLATVAKAPVVDEADLEAMKK
jgi:hypothetical protein